MRPLYLLGPFILLLTIAPLGEGTAQDIHFSQFTNAPSNLNPALTGGFEGDYRFIGIHRNQWNAVTEPYSTFGVSADANSFQDIGPLGVGASFYHDIAGDSRYRTLQAAVSGSWKVHLSTDSSHRLIAGIRPRFEQKRISYDRLQFDKQYNGVRYDPSRSSGEDFARDQRAYMETDLGVRYRKVAGKRKRYGGGVALYNLFATEQSFYDNPAVQRDRRMTFFAQGEHPLSEEVILQPSAYLGLQGTYHELIMGSEAEYVLHESLLRYRSVFAGLFYRTRDAGYVMAGMQYDEWRVALSYDINVSDLQPASRGRGGFEISVRYIMRTFERPDELHKTCPTFI